MRILIIEDTGRVARFLEKGLRSEQFQTEIAYEGLRGFEMALSGGYDLVILDVMLPDKSGMEICRDLRDHGLQVPILMLTAKDEVSDKIKGFESGADDYLTKPFSFEELLARVRALLRRGKSFETDPVLQVDDLVLDPSTHEVTRAGRSIELTSKEFALLEYLMGNVNRVLSRSMIEERVWGYQEDPMTNVVDVYIRRLRRKMDEGFDNPLIHTVRGVGYQLKAPR
jgi:DNA-binding response OmpR family regulator